MIKAYSARVALRGWIWGGSGAPVAPVSQGTLSEPKAVCGTRSTGRLPHLGQQAAPMVGRPLRTLPRGPPGGTERRRGLPEDHHLAQALPGTEAFTPRTVLPPSRQARPFRRRRPVHTAGQVAWTCL